MLLFKYYLKNSEIIFCIGLLTKKYTVVTKKLGVLKLQKRVKIECIKCLDSEKHQDRYFWSSIDK